MVEPLHLYLQNLLSVAFYTVLPDCSNTAGATGERWGVRCGGDGAVEMCAGCIILSNGLICSEKYLY
jgi:hypothetical protein